MGSKVIRIIRGELIAVVAPRALLETFGSVGIPAITHDQIRGFLTAKGRPQNSVKRYVEKLRNHPDVLHVVKFIQALKVKECPIHIGPMDDDNDSSVGLAQALLAADAVSDTVIILARLAGNGKGYDAQSYTTAKNNGVIEARPLNGDVALAYVADETLTLPRVIGVTERLENLPEKLRRNILAGYYRGKSSYGTDTAYIRVMGGLQLYGFKPHRDPAIIEVNGNPCLLIYGDTLNGLATVIREIMAGAIRKVAYFDVIRV